MGETYRVCRVRSVYILCVYIYKYTQTHTYVYTTVRYVCTHARAVLFRRKLIASRRRRRRRRRPRPRPRYLFLVDTPRHGQRKERAAGNRGSRSTPDKSTDRAINCKYKTSAAAKEKIKNNKNRPRPTRTTEATRRTGRRRRHARHTT